MTRGARPGALIAFQSIRAALKFRGTRIFVRLLIWLLTTAAMEMESGLANSLRQHSVGTYLISVVPLGFVMILGSIG